MQRIEAERAARRRRATQNNEAAKAVSLNSNEQDGNTLDAVASSLGISRDRWYKIRTIFERAKSGDAHRPRWKPSERTIHRKRMKIVPLLVGKALQGAVVGAGRV